MVSLHSYGPKDILKSDITLHTSRKKKKKEKIIDKRLQQISTGTDSGGEQPEGSYFMRKRTKAELAFEYVKKKREFNKHLDSMTEHFDIPKVSWTK
ncbi:hypothetical protein LSH36_433g02030 [Paralvinella palmiformis]|uniref:Protein FAM32A n=1 Tax=Paralvinella palmiformis TaxID=53620 RepID=A0AAD9JBY2_9ANNE|nr:hypothetical protein LSH36_433g02030 [Paralvinella palmiformis]